MHSFSLLFLWPSQYLPIQSKQWHQLGICGQLGCRRRLSLIEIAFCNNNHKRWYHDTTIIIIVTIISTSVTVIRLIRNISTPWTFLLKNYQLPNNICFVYFVCYIVFSGCFGDLGFLPLFSPQNFSSQTISF